MSDDIEPILEDACDEDVTDQRTYSQVNINDTPVGISVNENHINGSVYVWLSNADDDVDTRFDALEYASTTELEDVIKGWVESKRN